MGGLALYSFIRVRSETEPKASGLLSVKAQTKIGYNVAVPLQGINKTIIGREDAGVQGSILTCYKEYK